MIQLSRFYNEDCIKTMDRIAGPFVDFTLASPPYDKLRKYDGYNFDFEACAQGLYRITKTGGSSFG